MLSSNDAQSDGKAQAGTASRAAGGRFSAMEGGKHRLAFVQRNTRSIIVDNNFNDFVRPPYPYSRPLTVTQGVAHDVEHAVQKREPLIARLID